MSGRRLVMWTRRNGDDGEGLLGAVCAKTREEFRWSKSVLRFPSQRALPLIIIIELTNNNNNKQCVSARDTNRSTTPLSEFERNTKCRILIGRIAHEPPTSGFAAPFYNYYSGFSEPVYFLSEARVPYQGVKRLLVYIWAAQISSHVFRVGQRWARPRDEDIFGNEYNYYENLFGNY